MERVTYLSGQVELAVQWLGVLNGLASDHLLVKPDLVVGRGAGNEMRADFLRELVRLAMYFRKGGNG